MSNLNPESKYRNPVEVQESILAEFKKTIHTALPATIQTYDNNTKRAKVLPAINRLFTDDTNAPLPVLSDVPVIFPSGGGFTMHFPIKSGDVVMLLFSMRGIQNFKQDYQRSNPTNENIADYDSPVAFAGFGQISFTPAESSSASLQTDDGQNAVVISNSEAKLKVGSATLTLNASSLTSSVPIAAPDFTSLTDEEATFSKGIITTENVVAGNISLKTHIHIDSLSGNTSAPV